MSNYSYKKGVEDGREGRSPDLINEENNASDYIFGTWASKEERKASNDDYKRGYDSGTRQRESDISSNDDSSSNDGGSGK